MLNEEKEQEVALLLANRAYLYSLFHVVFGAFPTEEILSKMFDEETLNALKYEFKLTEETSDASLKERVICSQSGLSLTGSYEEIFACVKTVKPYTKDAATVEQIQSDYNKLFKVPGDYYVHAWESPYIGKENMLFQESTLEVRNYYYAAGFKLCGERHYPDDHIAAMMDYLGRTSQQIYEAYADGEDEKVIELLKLQRDFSKKHLVKWIGKFADAVVEKDAHAVYAAFAEGMAAFVHTDFEQYNVLIGSLETLQA